MGSIGERARARSDSAGKEQAFSALLLARIAYLVAGLAMAGLTVWGATSIWLFAGGPTGAHAILFVPLALAAIAFLGARYVVHRPGTWAIVLAIVWFLPILGVVAGGRVSLAHAAGVFCVLVGCVSIFHVRGAGHGSRWLKIGRGRPVQDGSSMRIDYPIELPYAAYLQSDWEWRDGRWTLMRIDFADEFR